MDVSVKHPFRIELDVLAIEDRFPSINFAIYVEEGRTSAKLSYHDTIWVDQAVWSRFLDELASSDLVSLRRSRRLIEFADLDEAFRFRLCLVEDDAIVLRVSYGVQRLRRHVAFELAEQVDDDTFGHLQRAFAACPVR